MVKFNLLTASVFTRAVILSHLLPLFCEEGEVYRAISDKILDSAFVCKKGKKQNKKQ